MIRAVPALVLAFALGACGSPAPSGGGIPSAAPSDDPVAGTPCGEQIAHGEDPEDAVSYSPCPGEGDASGGPKAERVEPVGGQAGVRAVSWERARPKGAGLRVFFWSGVEPCNVLDRVEVEETKREILVTLFEGHTPRDGDMACIEIAVYKFVDVELKAPVGDRKIIDGAVSGK